DPQEVGRPAQDLEVLGRVDRLHQLRGQAIDVLDLTALEHGYSGRRVGDDHELEALDLGGIAPVAVVTFDGDVLALVPRNELEGSGPDRMASQVGTELRDRSGARDAGVAGRQQENERTVWRLEVDTHGVFVYYLNGCHGAELTAGAGCDAGLVHH